MCHFLLRVAVCITCSPVRKAKVATTSFRIRRKRSQKNQVSAFSGRPRKLHNVILGGCTESQTAALQTFRILQCFNLVCEQGRGGRGTSTSEGPDTHTTVVKHGCILAHSHAITVRFRKPLLSAHQSLLSIRSTHDKPRR